jgi:hypothetical protein
MIGTSPIHNPGNSIRIPNRLYRCPKENYPELFEDLIMTGHHAILVDQITDQQRKELKDIMGRIFVTDNKYRLISHLDERSVPYEREGVFSVWHLALDNDDYFMNYGIFANGLLVETCSKRYIKELSGMSLIE